MRRFVLIAVIVSLGNASVAFAGESLLGAASKVARERADLRQAPKSTATTSAQKQWSARSLAATMMVPETPGMAQETPALSTSGMRKRTKFLIFLGAAVGVTAAWYTIDQKVEDNTPSSLGLRED